MSDHGDEPAPRRRRRKRGEVDLPTSEKLELAPIGLAGKKAGEPTIVRWVARNIDNPYATDEDCPDPFAWTLLRMCRENAGFLPFFVEKLWAKLLPSRSQVDSGASRVIDGKPTIELIERIQSMRDEAEECQVASPPETPPDVFNDFQPDEGDTC